MNFNGFQKMTLLDFPGHVACTLFTAGCNMRCPFCHNACLVTGTEETETYTEEEIMEFLKKRNGILDGVAITGGEPLLHKETVEFIKKVKDLGMAVKLDTNGTFPDRLKEAVTAGVDYIAMDIKNCPSKYPETVGLSDFDISGVKESVRFLLSGNVDYEFRTTVVRKFHEPEDFEKIAEFIKGAKRYFLQNFVDSGNLIDPEMEGVTPEEMRKMCDIARGHGLNAEVRGL